MIKIKIKIGSLTYLAVSSEHRSFLFQVGATDVAGTLFQKALCGSINTFLYQTNFVLILDLKHQKVEQ